MELEKEVRSVVTRVRFQTRLFKTDATVRYPWGMHSRDRYRGGKNSQGERHGLGEMEWATGRYIGKWENDRKQGLGEYHYEDGSVYRGEVSGLNHHGLGEYITSCGVFFKGRWIHGTINGKHRLDLTSGEELLRQRRRQELQHMLLAFYKGTLDEINCEDIRREVGSFLYKK